jgi:hypothetical protein
MENCDSRMPNEATAGKRLGVAIAGPRWPFAESAHPAFLDAKGSTPAVRRS